MIEDISAETDLDRTVIGTARSATILAADVD